MDRDLDGQISLEDFEKSFKLFYKSAFKEDSEVKQTLNVLKIFQNCLLESDSTGISWHNFKLLACKKTEMLTETNIKETFRQFDIFSKGYLSFDDLERFYGNRENRVWNLILQDSLESIGQK